MSVTISEPEIDQELQVTEDGARMLELAGYIVKCGCCGDYHSNDAAGITFYDVKWRVAEAFSPVV
jgi:hypothetical protein